MNPMDAPLSPADLWRKLRSVDFAILDNLAFLSRLRARQSPNGAHYATPGRAWLAQQCGVSIRTITRRTTRLKRIGALDKFQRRPIDGKWQTNLYALVGRASWLVVRSMQGLHRGSHRRPETAHKPPQEGKADLRGDGRLAFQAFLINLTRKMKGG